MAGGMAVGALDFVALAAFGALGFISEDFILENPGIRGIIGYTPRLDFSNREAMQFAFTFCFFTKKNLFNG